MRRAGWVLTSRANDTYAANWYSCLVLHTCQFPHALVSIDNEALNGDLFLQQKSLLASRLDLQYPNFQSLTIGTARSTIAATVAVQMPHKAAMIHP